MTAANGLQHFPQDDTVLRQLTLTRHWREDAACATTDPNLFMPDPSNKADQAKAKRICAGCDVLDNCLAWALLKNERFGIWGGTSEAERRRMRRRKDVSAERAKAILEYQNIQEMHRKGVSAERIAKRVMKSPSHVKNVINSDPAALEERLARIETRFAAETNEDGEQEMENAS